MATVEHAGFFVLRSPFLPFRTFAALADAPWPLLRELIRSDAAVREAIFIASPEVYGAALADLVDPPERLQRALLRYVTRMASRSTPFGLFAGVARGTIAKETNLALGGGDQARRHVRLDHGYLSRLIDAYVEEPRLRRALVCTPNETIYRHAGELRYVESFSENGMRMYRLSSLAIDDALLSTLERARGGATLDFLAVALAADDEEIELEDARAYVDELLALDVLRHELVPALTGEDALDQVVARLSEKGERERAALLGSTGARMRELDHVAPGGIAPEVWRAIAEALPDGEAALDRGKLVQVDMAFAAPELTLGRSAVDAMTGAALVLHRLFGRARDAELETFRERFRERFDRREVPLLLALDADAGVPFGDREAPDVAPLVEGLELPSKAKAESFTRGPVEDLLLGKLHEALSGGLMEIEITREEADALPLPEPRPLPATFAIYGAMLAAGDGEPFVRIDGVAGASGARLLGRFCAVLPQLEKDVREYLRHEQDGESILAEIVHVPEGRIGNVVARPVLYDYEIPLVSRSGVPAERQIALDDLRLSVVGDELVLRSARLNRRVIPRLTTAHNYRAAMNLPLYRLLCILQAQSEATTFSWSWSSLKRAPFLPRVRYGRTILAPAQWTVPAMRLATAEAVAEARRSLRLPRYLEHDRLVIDLENALSVEELVRMARKFPTLRLREMLPGPGHLAARTPEGTIVHELVLPVIRREARARVQPRKASSVAIRRSWPPGSEWTYLKLYGGRSVADRLLTELVAPVARELVRSGAARLWFFARYADPEPHLRVRIQGDPISIVRRWSEVVQPYAAEGTVWRMQYDTYEREVERYGGALGIEPAELLFGHDSEAAADLIALALPPGERWQAALASVHGLLESAAGDAAMRRTIVGALRSSFAGEFGATARTRRDIGRRFRTFAPSLEAARADVADILHRRATAMQPVVESLHSLRDEGRLTVPWDRFVISCVHMNLNRLLASEQRIHELVIYDFLERLYARIEHMP